MKLLYLKNCFLLFILLYMFIMFNGTNMSVYGITNWLYSYEYGFSKRALMGTILKIFAGNNISFEDFKSWIRIFHNVAIIIFSILVIITFNLTDRTFFSLISFVIFLTSMFVRNDFLLVGYVDIWVTNLLLIALILFLTNHNLLFFISIIISSLVHELTIFFVPAICVFFLFKGTNKSKAIYLACSLVTCFIITFISSFFYDKTTLKTILSIYPELYSYSKDHIELVSNELLKHYSVMELIAERLQVILKFIQNEIFAFVYYGFTSLILLFITFSKLKKELNYWHKLLLYTVVMIPCFVTFIATDLWRVASFYIFSIFIVYLCCNKMQLIEINQSISNNFCKTFLLISLVFQCSMPYIYFSRENTGFIDTNYCKYNSLIKDTLFHDFAKLLVFNYTYTEQYKSYVKEGPYNCRAKGNKSISLILYPGKNRVNIYSSSNQNDIHFVGIKSQKYALDNNKSELFLYQSMDSAVAGASNLFCLPSNEDWQIDRIEVDLIE